MCSAIAEIKFSRGIFFITCDQSSPRDIRLGIVGGWGAGGVSIFKPA